MMMFKLGLVTVMIYEYIMMALLLLLITMREI